VKKEMSISQVDYSSTSSMPAIVEAGDNSSMDKLDFLNLLTVQLANQDPSDPVDTNQMTQQTVMYAELEQLMNLNDTISTFVTSQEDMMLGIASVFNTLESTSFLGKDVSFFTNEVTVNEDGTVDAPLYYDLTQAAEIGYTVENAAGRTVKIVDQEAVSPDNNIAVGWDGTDATGNPVPAGTYTITLNAQDADGVALSGKTYTNQTVSAVDFREGTPILTLTDGRQVNVTEILSVLQPLQENE
jgi:flagellar basal-body rod modification protein FlgD